MQCSTLLLMLVGAINAPTCTDPRAGQDARFLLDTLKTTHPNAVHSTSWSVLESQSADASECGIRTDQRIARLAKLAASVGDGHTVLPLLDLPFEAAPKGPTKAMLPLRFEWFDDGLFVVGTGGDHRALLGQRVDEIGGLKIDKVLERTMRLLPQGTPRFQQEYAPEWLMSDIVLRDVGAWSGSGPVHISTSAGHFDVALVSPDKKFDWLRTRRDGPLIDWIAGTGAAEATLNMTDHPTPTTVRWRLVELRASQGKKWSEDLNSVKAKFQPAMIQRLVIDLRDNIGGDGTLAPAIIDMLAAPKWRRPGSVYVLIGRRCHSACVMLVSALEARGNLQFVGQPTGDAPNHFGETNLFVLPELRIPVIVASRYYQTGTPGDRRPWKEPDVRIPFLHRDYAEGRDAAMTWVLSQELPQ